MLVSSPKYLAAFLTLFALILFFLTRYHTAENSFGQEETAYAFEASDQIVIGGRMTNLQDTAVYDKLSSGTPSDIEANWAATVSAKSLLHKVRQFRISTLASYNDGSKKGVRQALEEAELELQHLGKESFDTKKIRQSVQKLKIALKAAESVIVQGPGPGIMTSKAAIGDEVDTQ